jgi:hypothetical protein
MTVGQPETNLDTWGLRYVKKKKGDAIDSTGDAPTKSPQSTISDLDSATANPSGRQNDSSGDTTGRYSARQSHQTEGITSHGRKVGEQVHEHKQEKDSEFGQKKPTYTTSGTKRGEGATHGADTTPTGQGEAGQALTAGTKKKPVTTSAGLEGSKQTHTGSKGFDWARNPQTSRGGHSIKPAKQGEGSSAKPSKNIQRAALDLAIIKCKILKMNNIQKDFIEDNKPTRPQFRKDDDEKGDKEKSESKCVSCGQKVDKPKEGQKTSEEYSANEKHQIDNPASKYDHYKSNEVVDKAIELINEAYDEMKSTDFRKLKPIYEGDTKEAKKGDDLDLTHLDEKKGEHKWVAGNDPSGKPDEYCKECGKTRTDKDKDAPASTSDVGAANFVYSDVAEAKKQKQKQ